VANHKKNPSPPPTPNDSHSKEKLDLNKHLFTISADRSVIDAFKIIYNYKVSALGVLEKKGKERNVDDDDESSSSESDSYDESSSSSSSSSGEEEESVKRRKDQEKARGPSLKEAKAMVEATRDSSSDDDDESSSESDNSSDSDDSAASSSEDEPGNNAATTTTSTANHHPSQQSATNRQRPASPKSTTDSQALSSHTKPTRSQSDPLGLSASKRANAHDASDTVPAKAKTHHGSAATKERKPSGSRGKRAPARITREEMVVRAAQAGKLISHLSSSDLKNFEPFAMMRCLHMSIKEYLACFKEKKPLVTCRRDTTLLQLLEKMAREEVNRIWLLADEEDDDDEEEEGDKGHDRKAKHEPKDNGGRPIGMISLADIIAEVTRL
jgi:CBS domain-containing protein